MTDSKKKRMSMLDSLAAPAGPVAAAPMMSNNRALRSARDAVDGHHVWDLDPADIEDARIGDRLDPRDVADLRVSIEAHGQAVPILVRRHPDDPKRYLLVYGRRRLEAIRTSDKVRKVRALIATLDDGAAVRAQVSENTARRDLSFIERALFARALVESGFGSQAEVADVLNLSKSAISMALSVARGVASDLVAAIGPACGVGRPRWEALVRDLAQTRIAVADLVHVAEAARAEANSALAGAAAGWPGEARDPSVAAFEAVENRLRKGATKAAARRAGAPVRPLRLGGAAAGSIRRTAKGIRLDVHTGDPAFADWLDTHAEAVLEELHARWQRGS